MHNESKMRYFYWEFYVIFVFPWAIINIPIQTLILLPSWWFLFHKMIISHLELGLPAVVLTFLSWSWCSLNRAILFLNCYRWGISFHHWSYWTWLQCQTRSLCCWESSQPKVSSLHNIPTIFTIFHIWLKTLYLTLFIKKSTTHLGEFGVVC